MSTIGGPGAVPRTDGSMAARRRLRLFWISCGTALLLLFLGATAGGLAYLVLSERADEASRTTYAGDGYSFDHPVEWSEPVASSGNEWEEQEVRLQNADQSEYFTVLDHQGAMTAEEMCTSNAELIDAQDLGTHQNELVGERDVDGRPALHHRAVAKDRPGDFPTSVVETWCIQKPDGVTLVVAQTQGEGPDVVPMPEAERILDSWRWLSGDEG